MDNTTAETKSHLSPKEIFNACPTAMVIINAKGMVHWCNLAAESLFRRKIINEPWLSILNDEFSPRDDDGHQVSMVDGRRVNVAIASLPTLPGQLVTLTDITTTREYEQKKEDQKRLAALGQMTAQLAHQIRTPLASARLYCDNISLSPTLSEKSKTYLSKIQQCHSSIETQIQDLLLFAKGQMIAPVSTNLLLWVENLLVKIEPLFALEGLTLLVNNQLVNQCFMLHEESLSGAILNLLMNALQMGATEVCCDLLLDCENNLIIRVTDNGPGMSKETKAQAFSPFYTTRAQGTGLGLAVVKAVALAHKGEVIIESELGNGCCVMMKIPEKG